MRVRPHVVFCAITLVVLSASLTSSIVPEKRKDGFQRIFDGKTLNGWSKPEGTHWSVEDGTITARSTTSNPAVKSYFLVWQGSYIGDFELKLKFRIAGDIKANSGIQFRSAFTPEGTHAVGYQADIALDPKWLGCQYDEGTGRKLLAGRGEKTVIDEWGNRETVRFADPTKLFSVLKHNAWNDYYVVARGNHFKAMINGRLMSEVIDADKNNFHATGRLALQLHGGGITEVKFKDIFIKLDSEKAEPSSALPEFIEESQAETADLTPANGYPEPTTYVTWHRSNGDAASSRYSLLDQINRRNIRDLKVAWTYNSKDGAGSIQCNPIIVDGVMFAPTPGDNLVAINAETGKEIWRVNPGGRQPARRGLLYWRGEGQDPPRVLFVSGDYLVALDPATGRPIADFGENGKVRTGPVAVAGAIYRDVLVIPSWHEARVTGYSVRTGKQLWAFNTIPQPGEYGADTWEKREYGANCWGGMSMDEQRGVAYIATGSPKPNFFGMNHRGRNLFANCVIALDALNGQRLWHFQEIRHDIWDLDIPAPPNLVTISRQGKRVDAVAQVTKLGYVLLLDRLTGKPLFPFRLRRAQASNLPGEIAWPYQPDIEFPERFSDRVFTTEDVTDRSPEARKYILQRLANATMGWFKPAEEGKPNAYYGLHGGAVWPGAAFDPATGFLYVTVNKIPWIITAYQTDEIERDPNLPATEGERVYLEHCASCHGPNRDGGFEGEVPPLIGLRHRMSDKAVVRLIDNGLGLMPAVALTEREKSGVLDFIFLRDRQKNASTTGAGAPTRYSHNSYPRLLDQEGYPGCKPPWGTLVCMNLNTGKIVWKSVLGEYEELTAQGIPKTGTTNIGGATVTAGGLVFVAGTRDNKIRAFDKDTGEEVWMHALPFGGYAPPATYEVNGRQYVVIAATGGGYPGTGVIAGPKEKGDAYVAFALPDSAITSGKRPARPN